MMKIVVLTGSPHHPGTSEQLADAFVKGRALLKQEMKFIALMLDAGPMNFR